MLNILLNSSEDPAKLSATVSGLILAFSGTIILLAGKFGLVLAADQVSSLAAEIGIGIGALWTLFGIFRKVVNIFRNPTPTVA